MGRGRPKKYKTEEERKAAKKEYRKQYYQKNAEKVKERARSYYQENPDKAKESQRQWREENPDYFKRWYQENREEKIDYEKEKKKQYYNTPMGRAVHLVSSYQQADKKYNRGECTLTAKWIVDNIFSKPCHYNCGETDWKKIGCDRIDNDLPHTPDNVVPCCEECNKKRGTKTYEEFLLAHS